MNILSLFSNLDLLSVAVVVAATLILGFVVFFTNPKSVTNRAFLLFAFMTVAWGALNYVNYQIPNSDLAFWALRIAIFFAVWHAFSLFHLLYVFPQERVKYHRLYFTVLLPVVTITALLTLTPLVFSHVELVTEGRITKVANGPGIAIFSATVLGLVLGGLTILFKKVRRSSGADRVRLSTILVGILLTFILILVFNFIYPAFLNNANYVSLGALFIFPFIAFTSYSIFRHKFLNVKVVSTEVLVFTLALASILEIIFSESISIVLFRVAIFGLILILGILLINSVMKEVKQREELEIVTRQLGKANEKLQQLDQARADFITIASHQLRTPPATIKWYLAAIKSGDYGALPEEAATALSKAEATNNSLISLIDDLLNASRIERGKMEFAFGPANLEQLVALTVEQLQPLASIKSLVLVYEKPKKPLPEITADKEKLRQVVNNFIDNAIKYSKTGAITIRLTADTTNIKFSVTDSGKGISKDVIKTIFEKYTRGKDSATHATGLGLGLYVAKIIIGKHKGKVWAESAGEGKGSTFNFTLPIKSTLKGTSTLDLAESRK